MKKNSVALTPEQRKALEQFSTTGVHSVRMVNRAKIVLCLDTSENNKAMKQEEVAKHVGVSRKTVNDVKRAFLAAESVPAFLRRKKRQTPPVAPKVTGEVQARIIALACGQPPEGCARWTLQLLADKSVELKFVDSLSAMTVCRLLKKHNSSPT